MRSLLFPYDIFIRHYLPNMYMSGRYSEIGPFWQLRIISFKWDLLLTSHERYAQASGGIDTFVQIFVTCECLQDEYMQDTITCSSFPCAVFLPVKYCKALNDLNVWPKVKYKYI